MRCPGSTIGTTVPARGGSSARIRESTFGLLAFRRPPRAFSSGSARPPRAPDASGTPRPGSGLCWAWRIRAPSARRATARRRDRRRGPSGLTPAWPGSRCVLASPDAPPAHAAHAAPHAHRQTQAHAPRPAHARRSRRCSRPLRVPCSHWQMGAQGRRASRRAPAGGARSCCNGRLWPVKRCLGGCMPSPPAPSLHRRLRCGRS